MQQQTSSLSRARGVTNWALSCEQRHFRIRRLFTSFPLPTLGNVSFRRLLPLAPLPLLLVFTPGREGARRWKIISLFFESSAAVAVLAASAPCTKQPVQLLGNTPFPVSTSTDHCLYWNDSYNCYFYSHHHSMTTKPNLQDVTTM